MRSDALRLMQDKAFKDAVDRLERRYAGEWVSSETHQTAKREEAYRKTRVLRDIAFAIASEYENDLLEAQRAEQQAEFEREQEKERARYGDEFVVI